MCRFRRRFIYRFYFFIEITISLTYTHIGRRGIQTAKLETRSVENFLKNIEESKKSKN